MVAAAEASPSSAATGLEPGSPPEAAPRKQVLGACVRVCLLLALAGGGLHALARALWWPQTQDLLQVPTGLQGEDLMVVAAAVAVVTGARVALLSAWPEFRAATDASNQQVLPLLQPADLLVVSFLPGASEELLFRWGLLPLFPNPWLGVLVAGAVFGVLHNNGGRNPAFALWASCVGGLYGGALLYSHNILVPVAAHSLSNLASALYWRSSRGAGQQAGS